MQGILSERMDDILGRREEMVQLPTLNLAPGPTEEPDESQTTGVAEGPGSESEASNTDAALERRILDLPQALAISVRSNRDYTFEREELFLSALSLRQSDHDFSPQVASSLAYVFTNPNGSSDDQNIDLDFSVTQALPYGGSASIALNSSGFDQTGLDFGYDSAASVSISQPLLRGFGREVTYEPLVQAERSLVYAIRAFELFREDFSVDVARRFYDLVGQKQTIENEYNNLESSEFAYNQADALFKVGRTKELDALRARREVLNARNRVLTAEENYQLALDRFRIFLGLSEHEPIDVEAAPPPFVATHFELDSAIAAALENRLDLRTRRDRLEDVERNLRISRNGLLPDLDVSLNSGALISNGDDIFGSHFVHDSYDVRMTLELPLDRVDERASYRRAQISLDRERRALDQFEDSLVVEIQSTFRELERRLQSLQIQETIIGDETKRLRIAELRFERGEVSNRDVVEANLSLLDAQNTLIDEKVNYEISRLQLLRNLGILFIDDKGMWK